MKILHAYCLNYNIGDYALGIGLKNLLRKYLNVDLIGNTNIQGRYFDEYYINEVVNKKYDLLVVGGGGIIHGSHWPNGWFWLIDQNLIRLIRIPIIIYAVGDNYFEDELIPSRAVTHLKETFNQAIYFSVRNDGSLRRIKDQVGIMPKEIPDPGFHVGINTKYPRLINEKYVIIQIAYDKVKKRYGEDFEIQQFINEVRKIVLYLSKEYHVLLAPHVYEDVILSNVIASGMKNTSVWDFGFLAFDHVDVAISYYKYAEMVISMRGHGQIIPIGFDVPVIALCNHPKHRGLMDNLGLSKFVIDVCEKNLADKIIDRIIILKKNQADIKANLHQINITLCQNSEKAFAEINSKLHGS